MSTKIIQLVIKQILHQIDDYLHDILKIPFELYLNNDIEFSDKLIKSKELFIYLNKELCNIDILSIFREEMKKTSFNFHKFMQYPKFYNIFSVYMTRLFNVFASVNSIFNLDVNNFRENLSITHEEIKDKYNFKNGLLQQNVLYFFEKFLCLLSMKIPIAKNFSFKLDKTIFAQKMDEIYNRTQIKLKELLLLFESTDLGHYMQRDINLNKYKNNFEFVIQKNDYLIMDEDNIKELIEINDGDVHLESINYNESFILNNRKIYHIKVDQIKNILRNENQFENTFLKKKRKYENDELFIEEKVSLQYKSQQAMKFTINSMKEKINQKALPKGFLTFTPAKINFKLDN